MIHSGYLFPFFFIAMWFFVLFMLSRRGWADLAEKYAYDNPLQGTRVGIISAGINGINYNNCLVLKYNEEGFYLRPIIFFRPFHKALFIPWNEIKDVRDKKIFFAQLKQLVIGEPAIAFIQMKMSTFGKFERMVNFKVFKNRM